jgi:DNA-binding protein HU-beta
MNKNELIAEVASKTGQTKTTAAEVVEATFDAISAALSKGDEVKIAGFGNFAVTTRAASEGRNPQTGEPIKIPEQKAPKFRASKGLKDAVNV